MTRLKYSPGSSELFNGNSGFTFTKSPGLPACRLNPKARHASSSQQFNVRSCMQSAIAAWKSFSLSERQNWQNWVNYLPQSQRHDETKFLNAYDNFIKRQFYFNLANFPDLVILSNPVLTTYVKDPLSATLRNSSGSIFIDFKFDRSDNTLDCYCSLNLPSSVAVNTNRSQARYSFCIRNVSQSVDVTACFQDRFNRLPTQSESVFCEVLQAGRDNGQFFFPVKFKINYPSVTPKKVTLAYSVNSGVGLYNSYFQAKILIFQGIYIDRSKLLSLEVTFIPTNTIDVYIRAKIFTDVNNRAGAFVGASINRIRVRNPMSQPDTFFFDVSLSTGYYFILFDFDEILELGEFSDGEIKTNDNNQYSPGNMYISVNNEIFDLEGFDVFGNFWEL